MTTLKKYALKSDLAVWFGFLCFASALLLPQKAIAAAWYILDTPRFTVISEISESSTRDLANEYNQFIGSLLGILKIDERLLPKVTVVIFADKERSRPYFQRRPNGKPSEADGYCAHHEVWPFLVMTAECDKERVFHGVLHEATHWIVSIDRRRFPPWANEGTAEVFATFSISRDHATWGQVIPEHVKLLCQKEPMSLEALFSTSYSGHMFDDKFRTNLFYAQSWALVHYLMFGVRNEGGTLDDLIAASENGAPTEEAFRKIFGIGFGEMERRLRSYVVQGRHRVPSIPVPVSAKITAPFLPAPPAMATATLARLAVHAGNRARANKLAEEAVRLDPAYAGGYLSLAFTRFKEQNWDAAIEAAEKAIQLNAQDAGAFWLLAEARYKKGKAPGGMTSAEPRQIANLFEKAISRGPMIKSAYVDLAAVLACLGKDELTEQDDLVLQHGQKLSPHEQAIQIGRAQLARTIGDEKKALEILDAVSSKCRSFTAEQQEQIAKLRLLCTPATRPVDHAK